jgi:hypothetical protein
MAQAALLNGQHTVSAVGNMLLSAAATLHPYPHQTSPNFTKNDSMRNVSMRFSQQV